VTCANLTLLLQASRVLATRSKCGRLTLNPAPRFSFVPANHPFIRARESIDRSQRPAAPTVFSRSFADLKRKLRNGLTMLAMALTLAWSSGEIVLSCSWAFVILSADILLMTGGIRAPRSASAGGDHAPQAVRAHDRNLLWSCAAWARKAQGHATSATTRVECAGVQRRNRVSLTAASGATRDLWSTRADSALAWLSRDVPAALAHRAGAADIAQAGSEAWEGNKDQR